MFQSIQTEFQMLGQSKYSQLEMTNRIKDLIRNHYGLNLNIGGNDWSRYYRKEDGAKVTKTLTGILRKAVTKQMVERNFPKFAKDVAELYHPVTTLRAYFGDKSELGEGLYEPGATCIAKGHGNQGTKFFVGAWKRTQMLCLEHANGHGTGRARCIAYFPGGRNVFLTNFYYNGLQQNRLLFVEAVRRLFKFDKVIWKTNETFFLPIYRNGECIHVHPERFSDHLDKKRKLPCPHCGKMVPEADYYYSENGHTRLMGCSKDCALEASGMLKICPFCDSRVNRDQMHRFRTDTWICGPCYTNYTHQCSRCGGRYTEEEGDDTEDGAFRCYPCLEKTPHCHICAKKFASNVCQTNDRDSHGKYRYLCHACLERHKRMCNKCNGIFSFELTTVKKRHFKHVYCDNCLRAAGLKSRSEEEIVEEELPDDTSTNEGSYTISWSAYIQQPGGSSTGNF